MEYSLDFNFNHWILKSLRGASSALKSLVIKLVLLVKDHEYSNFEIVVGTFDAV